MWADRLLLYTLSTDGLCTVYSLCDIGPVRYIWEERLLLYTLSTDGLSATHCVI